MFRDLQADLELLARRVQLLEAIIWPGNAALCWTTIELTLRKGGHLFFSLVSDLIINSGYIQITSLIKKETHFKPETNLSTRILVCVREDKPLL